MMTAPLVPSTTPAQIGRGGSLTVGIDVGGTKTACVVTDADDRVLLHEVEPTEPDRLAGQLSDICRRAIEQVAGDGRRSVAAVGIAVPGRVETRTGMVGLAVNLGGANLALGPLVEESVGLPCYVEHDARAAAAWLYACSRERGKSDDVAYLSIGTGISAGIVLDGHVLRGANGLAGEVGHTLADPADGRCACGLLGCVEVVAAGPAIARQARLAAAEDDTTILTATATSADVFSAAEQGDMLADDLARAIADRLARAIRGLVLTLGVNHVIVGGGVASAGDALLNRLLDAIGRERAASPLVEAAFAQATIEVIAPQVEAGARGAAAIARQRVEAAQREGVGDR